MAIEVKFNDFKKRLLMENLTAGALTPVVNVGPATATAIPSSVPGPTASIPVSLLQDGEYHAVFLWEFSQSVAPTNVMATGIHVLTDGAAFNPTFNPSGRVCYTTVSQTNVSGGASCACDFTIFNGKVYAAPIVNSTILGHLLFLAQPFVSSVDLWLGGAVGGGITGWQMRFLAFKLYKWS